MVGVRFADNTECRPSRQRAAAFVQFVRMGIPPETPSDPTGPPARQGKPAWTLFTAGFGVVCLLVGLFLVARLIGRAVGPRAFAVACCALVAGVLLIPTAWIKRRKRPAPSAAESRAQDADNQPIPPREA